MRFEDSVMYKIFESVAMAIDDNGIYHLVLGFPILMVFVIICAPIALVIDFFLACYAVIK